MVLNKLTKKNTIQLILFSIGILLIFLIYFSNTPKKNNKKLSENTSNIIDSELENNNRNVFENLEYKNTDKNGNKFIIFSEYSDFETNKPEIINMKNIVCYFYLKDGILEIRSKIAKYNNVTLDMSFFENVGMYYKDSILYSDRADFVNETSQLTVEGNVTGNTPNGELSADKLNFSDKKLSVTMYSNDESVNIKTNLR